MLHFSSFNVVHEYIFVLIRIWKTQLQKLDIFSKMSEIFSTGLAAQIQIPLHLQYNKRQ